MELRGSTFSIKPVGEQQIAEILEVYRQCEDFLALGPVSKASVEMVRADLQHSVNDGGVFCGIYDVSGYMFGVVDYIRDNFEGKSGTAFLSLLMIAQPHRRKGIGREVVEVVEADITRNEAITQIESGVQVNNPGAVRFWKAMGYEISGEARHFPDQTTAYPLRKRIR